MLLIETFLKVWQGFLKEFRGESKRKVKITTEEKGEKKEKREKKFGEGKMLPKSSLSKCKF